MPVDVELREDHAGVAHYVALTRCEATRAPTLERARWMRRCDAQLIHVFSHTAPFVTCIVCLAKDLSDAGP